MRCSRSRADSAWARMRAARLLITRPTSSMTANVTAYWVSDTAKVRYGGTKKKSNAATLSTEASSEGPRPVRVATTITLSRYTMMRFDGAKWLNMAQAIPVETATAPTAYP